MTALVVTACIIWCVCAAKSNRQKDGFHRLRQQRDDYDDEIRLTSMGSKKSLLAHEFQDESESDEETLYANKIWELLHQFSCWPSILFRFFFFNLTLGQQGIIQGSILSSLYDARVIKTLSSVIPMRCEHSLLVTALLMQLNWKSCWCSGWWTCFCLLCSISTWLVQEWGRDGG